MYKKVLYKRFFEYINKKIKEFKINKIIFFFNL